MRRALLIALLVAILLALPASCAACIRIRPDGPLTRLWVYRYYPLVEFCEKWGGPDAWHYWKHPVRAPRVRPHRISIPAEIEPRVG